jgi:hypothetical protein
MKIDDCWQSIMEIVAHQPEENFLNEVLSNLRLSEFNSRNVN